MEKLFVPYKQNKPAYVSVNGHQLVIVSTDHEALEAALCFDSDSLHELEADPEDLESIIESLKGEIEGGIVFAPAEISPDELVESLQAELPWIQ
jgi:hypothetical protein